MSGNRTVCFGGTWYISCLCLGYPKLLIHRVKFQQRPRVKRFEGEPTNLASNVPAHPRYMRGELQRRANKPRSPS